MGSGILKTLLKKAWSDGNKSISLSIDPENIACRLYERDGFKKVGVTGTPGL